MADALQVQLEALADEVRAAAIPSDGKQTVLWCVEPLPTEVFWIVIGGIVLAIFLVIGFFMMGLP